MNLIEELYERIDELHSKLYWREDIEEKIREMLLHSTISIGECEEIFRYLNMPDNRVEE